MNTVANEELLQEVTSLQQSAAAALQNSSADEVEQFERNLNRFEATCREIQQSLWTDDARTAIGHLERNEPLTPADQDVIREFLISDAERYVALENNYQDWTAELQRLLGQMAARAGRIDRQSIADLRGVVKDAVRLVPDIRNYLDEYRRIERCAAALNTMDADSRALLARILKESLASPDR